MSKIRKVLLLAGLVGVVFAGSTIANASQLVEAKLETKLIPAPVEFNVLLPDGYETAKDPLPLLLFLHGGGGDRSFLTRLRAAIDDLLRDGRRRMTLAACGQDLVSNRYTVAAMLEDVVDMVAAMRQVGHAQSGCEAFNECFKSPCGTRTKATMANRVKSSSGSFNARWRRESGGGNTDQPESDTFRGSADKSRP